MVVQWIQDIMTPQTRTNVLKSILLLSATVLLVIRDHNLHIASFIDANIVLITVTHCIRNGAREASWRIYKEARVRGGDS